MGELAVLVLQSLPSIIAAGRDITGLVTGANDRIAAAQESGRPPTDADWKWVNEQIAALQAELHKP